jgi:hypothetical protein
MSLAFDRGCEFFETLFEALQGLRLDHSAHLAEAPDKAAALLVVELSVPHLAVDPACLCDDAGERVERTPDERALAAILPLIVYWGGLSDFVFLGQAVGPFSPVNFDPRGMWFAIVC